MSIWTVINKVIDKCPDCNRRKLEMKNPAPPLSGLQPYRFQLEHKTFWHAFIDILGPISTKDFIWVNTVGDVQTASNLLFADILHEINDWNIFCYPWLIVWMNSLAINHNDDFI